MRRRRRRMRRRKRKRMWRRRSMRRKKKEVEEGNTKNVRQEGIFDENEIENDDKGGSSEREGQRTEWEEVRGIGGDVGEVKRIELRETQLVVR
jgi:hypothetical protein